jgi:glycerol kinase
VSGATHGERVLAIDQGTSSTRAMVFAADGSVAGRAQREFRQHFPHPGWVEHDPEAIWASTVEVVGRALADSGPVAAIGITNQRETLVIWERAGGRAVYPAIVWQDRRTAAACEALRAAGAEPALSRRTGLLLDPYFSATKATWILDNVPGVRARAEAGELAMGTVDSFLLWRLTGGAVHATDASNASRTALYDIHRGDWDQELLDLFAVPRALLPSVRANTGPFGVTVAGPVPGGIPISGMAGDQQAAAIGQGCLAPGLVKCTYGTGCFILANTGQQVLASRNRLLATVAWADANGLHYAVEGSVFAAGSTVQWLRDGLGVIAAAADTQALAGTLHGNGGVYLVPAFTGLGAPHWDAAARGALFGLTRDTGPAHLARAALEAVCYQTRDLLHAMRADGVAEPRAMRVDGGMCANDWLLQFLADILDLPVERPAIIETSALGAAHLARVGAGLTASLDRAAGTWRLQRRFEPAMGATERAALLDGWREALSRTLTAR